MEQKELRHFQMSTQKQFDDTQLFGENKIAERYSELNAVLENLRNEEREILLKIKNIDNAFDTGSSFTQMLKDLKQQTSIAEIETDEYTCPLCGHECKEIAENDSKLIEATEWLDNELRITEKYTSDFSEDVRKLKEAHSKIDEKIRDVWKQIKTIEEKFISSKALVSKREKVNYAKARIALYAEMSSSGIFETVDGDIEELKEKIARLEEKIKGFDVDKKMSKAESFLSNNMNRLSLTLDFEEEYRPIDLNFGLTDGSFDIYQHQKSNENIHLYEMGSGANWVSCHIALFLSFLRFFATQDNSPMPLVMFFDQPSQVYFPQGNTLLLFVMLVIWLSIMVEEYIKNSINTINLKLATEKRTTNFIWNITTSLRCMMLFLILWIELLGLFHKVNEK